MSFLKYVLGRDQMSMPSFRSNVVWKYDSHLMMKMQKKKFSKEVMYLELWIAIFNWNLEMDMYDNLID
jgi:hypothetical protein